MKKTSFNARFKQNPYRSKRVAPDTTENFQCIMGACEDNCCRNTSWAITVDQQAYKKYQNLNNEVGRRILDCIEDTGKMLKFKQFEDGKCPLMLESGLCYIHKELGEGYLCDTCKTYPRTSNYFNKKLEYWLSLSCPEAVRHVLFQDKYLCLEETPFIMEAAPPAGPFEAEKAMVRDMLEDIIAYPLLTLKEKLLYMGVFMRSISKHSHYDSYYTQFIKKTIITYNDGLPGAINMLAELVEKLGVVETGSRNIILLNLVRYANVASVPPKQHPADIENAKYYTIMGSFHKDIMNGTVSRYLLDTFDKKIVPYIYHRFSRYKTIPN